MRKGIFATIALLFSFAELRSQDVYFSNEQNALLSFNPSFAGSNGFIRTQANCRAFYDQFNTYVGYDMRIKNSGLGLVYAHDDIRNGLYKSDVINLTYAHYFCLGDKKVKLVPSVQAGIFVKHLDVSKLTFADMQEQFGRYAFVRNWDYNPASQKINADASAGLLIQANKFIAGVSVHHFTQPDEGLWGVQKLPALFNVHTSYNVITKKDFLLNFSGRFIAQSKFQHLKLMSKALLFKHYIAGLGYEGQDYLVCHYGYRHNYFTISITSAYHIPGDDNFYYNRHELGVSFNLRNKDQRRAVTCIENW